MIETSRRKFITGLSALIVAPAIVRVESLMPVRSLITPTIIKNENDILTIQMITREAVELFNKHNEFLKNIDAQYQDRFANGGYKVGSQLRIRLPNNIRNF